MMTEEEGKLWYILSAKDGIKSLEQQFSAISALRQRRGDNEVEYFMPTCVEQSSVFGKPAMRRRKLMGNYVFVHDTYPNIIEIKAIINSLWLLPHPDNSRQGERRYMTISDSEMATFKAIARAYANELPCYPIDSVDLDEGDQVEIIGGEFDGMRGTLQCSQGRNGGKVLMAVGNLFLVSTPAIGPQYIRILQLDKGNRHPYRKFEAHLPRALQALAHAKSAGRTADANNGLTNEDIAAMAVFTGRFEALQPATVNIASQHATLMLMSYAALGDKEKTRQWFARCQEILSRVKSDTQRAWQLTFMYVAIGDENLRSQALALTESWAPVAADRKRTLILSHLEAPNQIR